jgi:hypothetical protein
MKHFGEAQWLDFVRDLTPAKERMAMQQHIDNGCRTCSNTLRTWQGVLSIAREEGTFNPPDDIVRVAKSQFSALQPIPSSGVRLVFDSMLQPLTAGTRGSVAARQFLYETDEYYIDLRLEPRTEAADRASLIGQVLERGGADRKTPGLAVRLQTGTKAIAHTSTNEFGEFQLEFVAAHSLCIAISRGEAPEIILPLYGVHIKSFKNNDLG